MLNFLYKTTIGRMMLACLTWPPVSKAAGSFCDSGLSRFLIPGFARKNQIDMTEYEEINYRSFNQFFCRKIKKGKRSIDSAPDALIAPCDGLLSTYKIEDGLVMPVKSSQFGMEDLLRSRTLAEEYNGGTCLVFRLCVNHYHRYIYLDDGRKGDNIFLPGVLHTVRPVALRERPVFIENSREYTILHTDHFGDVIQMEVGAMLVGRIKNLHGNAPVKRGQEKGYFEYGGSTIIVLVKPDAATFPEELYQATKEGREIPVTMGQRLNEK